MTITRKLSKLISQVLIGVMLLTQLAVASYACPSMSGTQGAPNPNSVSIMAMTSDAQVPKSIGPGSHCDEIDRDAANLCTEHCRIGQQSADTAPAPLVLAVAPALLYSLPVETESISGFMTPSSASYAVLAAPPPPHAILHCVSRT
jgi:hypothetical protein